MVADIETAHEDNGQGTGAVARWIVSIAMLIALTAVTATTLRWYQPLRTLFDDYLGVEVSRDRIVEPEAVSRSQQEIHVPPEFINTDESDELRDDNQEYDVTPDPLLENDTETPTSISAGDLFSVGDPIESARIELQFALVSIKSDSDLALAMDALRRAQSIASTNRMSPSITRLVDRALAEIDELSRLNLESIQARLDALSKVVVSIGSVLSEGASVSAPDTLINVSEEPESQSFWRELSDGITNVYRVRRIDESTPKAETFPVESSAQIRLIVILERARSDIRVHDFDSYRASINEAIAIVDSLSAENTGGLNSIKDELLDLESLELIAPHISIRTALKELMNEAAIQTVDSTAIEL
ncbi:MAG: hypothetical protein OXG15_04695 [Gammaproteobacteria bacterium]|nr:hypothetical protein [Gammaproteobacteria bacterium]